MSNIKSELEELKAASDRLAYTVDSLTHSVNQSYDVISLISIITILIRSISKYIIALTLKWRKSTLVDVGH